MESRPAMKTILLTLILLTVPTRDPFRPGTRIST